MNPAVGNGADYDEIRLGPDRGGDGCFCRLVLRDRKSSLDCGNNGLLTGGRPYLAVADDEDIAVLNHVLLTL